jgi:hypothetical protein
MGIRQGENVKKIRNWIGTQLYVHMEVPSRKFILVSLQSTQFV